MLNVIKRNGKKVNFDKNKIETAILKAMTRGSGIVRTDIAKEIADEIENELITSGMKQVTIHTIEDLVYIKLTNKEQVLTAKAYEEFRAVQAFKRECNTTDDSILGLVRGTNTEAINENSNKNAYKASTQRDLIAGEVSKDISRRKLVPAHLIQAHDAGLIHLHDLDYLIQPIPNCCLINLKDMFANGTVINNKLVTTPKSFRTACTVMTQIFAQVASGQFGGQSANIAHLAPYLRVSKERLYLEVLNEYREDGIEPTEKQIEKRVMKRLGKELKDGVQTIQYQINTLQTSNGQAPFVTLFMNINDDPEFEEETAMITEEIIRQRMKGIQNEQGVWISPTFPKILYVLDENNVRPGTKYYEITKLAAKCVMKRMMPDFISAKKMRENYGAVFSPMGCRSFLSRWINPETGELEWWGRQNLGVCSINLVDVALSANKDLDKFWTILDQRLELCHEALQVKANLLRGTSTEISPIHWRYGAISRLSKDDTIDKVIDSGKCTISLGYIGIHEMCQALLGQSNTSKEGHDLAVAVMNYMNNKCAEWKKQDGLAYGVYGTPAESLTYKFATKTKARFGVVPNVTDHDYLTNSYHICVREHVDAFEKIKFESEFQKLSSGGCISYIELPHSYANLHAVLHVIEFMYENLQYGEINTKSDYCQCCGFDGEIKVDENMEWYCPNCGNRDKSKMNVVRRTCGYLGENFWNEGRTEEIHDRVTHLD